MVCPLHWLFLIHLGFQFSGHKGLFYIYKYNNCLGLSFFASDWKSICFLNLKLEVYDKYVKIGTFRKSTVGNYILCGRSCHPAHTVKNIPVGEMICAQSNCALDSDFSAEADNITNRLRCRQYSKWSLCRARKKAAKKNREQLWKGNKKETSSSVFSTNFMLAIH